MTAASLSHWVLDLFVHVPDLPLYDNSAKVGFGAWFYARMTTFTNIRGRYAYWSFVVILAAVQVYANFGPPPSSPEAMAVTALVFYTVLAFAAAFVERIATVSTNLRHAPT